MADLPNLKDLLTLARLQSMTDTRTFVRGRAYYLNGAVGLVNESADKLDAEVHGTQRYHVRLSRDPDGTLAFQCDCPVGNDGILCKHVVAVALSWLEDGGDKTSRQTVNPSRPHRTPEERIQEYVDTLSEASLRKWLLDAAFRNEWLEEKLLFAADTESAADLAGMKAAILRATAVPRFLEWHEAGEYADRLAAVADRLERRLDSHYASQVVKLAELAIASAEEAMNELDDSGGTVMPAIQRLAELHRLACQRTRPHAIRLAERLFRLQTEGKWDTFYNVLPKYHEALGEAGVQHYRELVESAWGKLPALVPEQPDRAWDGRRMRLEQAMEALAALRGDVDAAVAIKSKDLSSPHRYLLIAELCRGHERFDDGLAWAERGLAAFPGSRDNRLLDFCVAESLRRGDHGKAEALAWDRFLVRSDAHSFAELISVAQATGSASRLSDEAMSRLWELVEHEELAKNKRREQWQSPKRDELVRIFLNEGDIDAAWAAFKGGAVSTALWKQMAATRAKTHPGDAIPLYQSLLPLAIEQGTAKARYNEAFQIVRAIKQLHSTLGQQAAFAEELASIRATHKAKRNFIKLLDMLK